MLFKEEMSTEQKVKIIRCSVKDCKNTSENFNLRFHSFPRNRELCIIWVAFTEDERLMQRVQMGSIAFLHGYRVCTMHFKNEDFQNDLRERLLRNRVPTLFPPGSPSSDFDIEAVRTAIAVATSVLCDSQPASHSPVKTRCPSPSSSVSHSPDESDSQDSRDYEDVQHINESEEQLKPSLQLQPSQHLQEQNFNKPCYQTAVNAVSSSSVSPDMWNTARVAEPPSFDLPKEDKILHLLLFVKNNRDSERLCPRDVDGINVLLNISADWRELPVSTRKYLYQRIRALGLVLHYGWEGVT